MDNLSLRQLKEKLIEKKDIQLNLNIANYKI